MLLKWFKEKNKKNHCHLPMFSYFPWVPVIFFSNRSCGKGSRLWSYRHKVAEHRSLLQCAVRFCQNLAALTLGSQFEQGNTFWERKECYYARRMSVITLIYFQNALGFIGNDETDNTGDNLICSR